MNFLCDNCKQKYHVADEKVRGRAVTRFKCKKCNHIIEFRGDMLDDAAAPSAGDDSAITVNSVVSAPPSAPPPAASSGARPAPAAPLGRARAGTVTASAVTGATAAAKPGPGAPATAASPPRQQTMAPPTSRPRPATTSAPAFGSAGFGARAGGVAPRSATARAEPAHAGDASAAAILNASETGWYAGIRDLPVGPLTRKELVAKVQAGEVSPDTLVWREGLDDWRPLRNVAELGDIIRLAAQRISGNLLDEMGKRAPAPAPTPERRGAQVVPLRPGVGPAAGGIASRPSVGDDDDEEATRVTGLDPAIAALIPRGIDKAPAPVARPAPAPPAAPAPKPAPVAEVTPPTAPPVAPVPEPPSTTSRTEVSAPAFSIEPPKVPEPVVAKPAEAHDDLPEDLFAKPATKPAAAAAAATAQPSAAARPQTPAWEPLHSPSGASMPAPAAGASLRPPPPRAGVSVGLLVLMGGVLIVGVAGGVYIGRANSPAPAPAPVRVNTPVVRTVAAQPELSPEVPAEAPVAPTPGVAPSAAPSVTPSNAARVAANTVDRNPRRNQPNAAAPSLTAQQQRELAALGVQGPALVPPTTAMRTVNTGAETPAQSSTNRGPAILRRFEESRVVHNCWQQYLRNNPAAQPSRIEVEVGVNATGRLTSVNVSNSPDPSFTQCLRTRVLSVAPIGPGDAMSARTSISLTQ